MSKQAYKDLVAMDTSFKKLVQMLEETGETRNAIMELEIKIEQLKVPESPFRTCLAFLPLVDECMCYRIV